MLRNKSIEFVRSNKPRTFVKNMNIEKFNFNVDYINKRIQKEICHETIKKLNDENLNDEYKKSISVNKRIKIFEDILEKNKVSENIKNNIISDYFNEIIPAGTKGTIKGNIFNNIVKEHIKNMELDPKRFEVCFEKHCPGYNTLEIPDWYIIDKNSSKKIIGMNQLDFWKGGHQRNRGNKYILENEYNKNIKLLCVICNEIVFKSDKGGTFNIFKVGFCKNTLCYIKNLENIIMSFFLL